MEKTKKMENQKYSGEVNIDHPIIEETEQGDIIHISELPRVLIKNKPDHGPPMTPEIEALWTTP